MPNRPRRRHPPQTGVGQWRPAHQQTAKIGLQNGPQAKTPADLAPGDAVIAPRGDNVAEGVEIAQR